MTHSEKEEIKARRVAGQSYAAIADTLGLRKDQVSAFCRRYIQKDICLNCGKPLTQIKGRKPIKFCNADGGTYETTGKIGKCNQLVIHQSDLLYHVRPQKTLRPQ